MKLALRITTVLLFIAGIIWIIVEPGFEPLTAFLTGVLTLLSSFIVDKRDEKESLDQRNRRILLNHVENFWIKGVLEKLLHGAALLELGIIKDPNTAKYSWSINKDGPYELLPSGKSMLEIFEQIGMGRSLLILGAPGSGKTTLLLELTRQLIEYARQNESEPVPIVLNLASWTEKFTVGDWLAQELNNLYSVPPKTALNWVRGNKLFLLLDGLDEVSQENRAQCVAAINLFNHEQGLTSIVVCSRSNEYTDLKPKLNLQGGIEIQPLTTQQVEEYFKLGGKSLAVAQRAFKRDSTLRELVVTPLFLNIMTSAYLNVRDDDIPAINNVEAQRSYLFDAYISRMLEHSHSSDRQFKDSDVIHWLSWIAHNMIAHDQSSYLFERMQPNWLSPKQEEFGYRLVLAEIIGLLVGSTSGIMVGLLGRPVFGLLSGLSAGLFIGLVGGALCWLVGLLLNIRNANLFSNDRQATIDLVKSAVVTLLFTLLFGIVIRMIWGPIYGLALGLIFWSVSSSGYLLVGLGEVHTYDLLTWSWDTAQKYLPLAVPISLVVGLLGGSVLWRLLVPLTGQLLESSERILFGLVVAAYMVMFALIVGGIHVSDMEERVIRPGQKLVYSFRNFLFTFLILGLSSGTILGIWFAMVFEPRLGLLGGVAVAVLIGLQSLEFGGGSAILQHLTLRLVISRNNLLPWKLIPFLDYCCDLIFLRRVGGGYIFMHRLLMEHFAEMYEKNKHS